jgi:LacI family transcriptional regulator
LDYRPSEVARSLSLRRTHTIGLILPDTLNPFFAALAKGVEDTGFRQGYSVFLCHSNYESKREGAYAELMISKQVDGVIIIQANRDSSAVRRLLERRIPAVAVDREDPDLRLDCVVADNFGGSVAATKHLLALGHRRIACIARASGLSNATERVRGYRVALREAGLRPDPRLLVAGGRTFAEGRQAMETLLKARPRPTAVFVTVDVLAIGAIRAIVDARLRVPQDISVVGFDDIPPAAFHCPTLTTVSMPKWELGQRAAEVLIARIQNANPGRAITRVVLPTSLIIRESTGVLRNGSRSPERVE